MPVPSQLLPLLLVACLASAFTASPRVTYTAEEMDFRHIVHEKWINHKNYLDEDGRRELLPMPEGLNSSHCPSSCQKLAANAECNADCDTAGCLRDLGDCRHNGVCHPLTCPDDGKCRIECELRGCSVGTCVLDKEKERQFVIVDLPKVNPYAFFGQMEKMEHFMEKQLGFWVSLQGNPDGPLVWGFEKETYAVKRLKYTDQTHQTLQKGDGSALQDRTIALFSVDAKKILTELDKKELGIIARLGTPDIKAAVIMMVLKNAESAAFNEVFVAIPREQQEQERRSKRRPRRHLKKREDEEDDE